MSLVMLLTVGSSCAFAARPVATPVPGYQTDQEELSVVMARYNTWNRHNRDGLAILTVLALFGALCAYWARSDFRNPVVWFLAGFFFNVLAVVIILNLHRRHHGKRRYRRVISYWYVSR